MSPSFKNLVSAFSLTDSFRCLHPKKVQFSRYYSNSQHGEGASRIDRCYHWGDLTAVEAEYHSISFSDHLSQRLVYTLPSPLDRKIAPKPSPQFKIPPEVVNDSKFTELLQVKLDIWNQVLEAGADPMTWWQHLVKKGILQLAREQQREMNKERGGLLNLLLVRLKTPKMGVFGYFGGTENGTWGARNKILRPLFNTNTPPKTPI